MKKFRVLHIVEGSLTGGAARGALWLHECCLDYGVDSILLVDTTEEVSGKSIMKFENGKLAFISKFIRRYFSSLVKIFYLNRKKITFSFNYGGCSIKSIVKKYSPDIVNLHWVNNGFLNVGSLGATNVKIVITLRDFWFVTGGCHYPIDCKKFLKICGECPQYGVPFLKNMDFIPNNHIQKSHIVNDGENVTLVAMNRQLESELVASQMFNKARIVYIPNGIPVNRFFRLDKEVCRRKLGLRNNGKAYLLVGANKLNSSYKAQNEFFSYVIRNELYKKYNFLVIGLDKSSLPEFCGDQFSFIGGVSSPEDLSYIYSAADIYIHTARQEMFGKMVAESISCGTPVVGFRQYGLIDLISKPSLGRLVEIGDYPGLFFAVDSVIDSFDGSISLSECFNIKSVSFEYIDLYHRLLGFKR